VLVPASILDHPLISYRYFFPRPCRFRDPFMVDCSDAVLGCSYHLHDPAAMTVIHFHGNGETVEDYLGDFVERFDRMGVNLLLAEYRGYGMSGGEPSMVRMLDDVERIVRAIRVPPERIVLFGRSLGSLYAIHGVKCFPQAAGLIIESGIADPLERLLLRVAPEELGVTLEELGREVARMFNNREKLAGYRGTTLVMHARNDDLVDVSHGERLYAWAGGGKELKIFERGDHNTILQVNTRAYFDSVAGFIHSLQVTSP
jgi:alpha-beta hydrolase superfamily lysophospholipase